MRENRVPTWMEVIGSLMKKIISEFNEIPPCVKRAESKQLSEDEFKFKFVPRTVVRGRKVAGPAVYKNIAEFNEIRTAYSGKTGAD